MYCNVEVQIYNDGNLLLGAVVVVVPVSRRYNVAAPAPLTGDGSQGLEPVERGRVEIEQLARQRRTGPEVRQHEHLTLRRHETYQTRL